MKLYVGIDGGASSTRGVLINQNGEYFGFFRPPFDVSKLSLTYQSVVTQ